MPDSSIHQSIIKAFVEFWSEEENEQHILNFFNKNTFYKKHIYPPIQDNHIANEVVRRKCAKQHFKPKLPCQNRPLEFRISNKICVKEPFTKVTHQLVCVVRCVWRALCYGNTTASNTTTFTTSALLSLAFPFSFCSKLISILISGLLVCLSDFFFVLSKAHKFSAVPKQALLCAFVHFSLVKRVEEGKQTEQ